MKEASDVLIDARSALIERGWCRGSLRDRDGRICVLGALSLAAYGDVLSPYQWGGRFLHHNNTNARAGAGRALAQATETGLLGFWNDRPERTFTDVIDAFDTAIIDAKQGEAGR